MHGGTKSGSEQRERGEEGEGGREGEEVTGGTE